MKCQVCNGKKYIGSKKKRVTCAACAGTGDATPTPLPPVRTDDPAMFDATPVDVMPPVGAGSQQAVTVGPGPGKIVIDIDVIARAFAGRVRATKE